jgi:carboxyl-terminal processing protease
VVRINSKRKIDDIKMKKKLLIATIVLFNFLNQAFAENVDKLYEKIDLFSEVLEKIQNEYVDEVDQSEAMDYAINGLLHSLDPYSAYMSPESFLETQTDTKGEFGGLGIEVSMEAGVVKVITPIDDTPASRAGIKAGDYIVRINGKQVQGKTLMESVNLMRGPVGSSIEITIRRKGLKKAKVFNIKREIIQIKSVVAKLIDNKIGYLRLSAFNENSSNQLKKEISKIEKNKKTLGYILDLRNNPGGLLQQAIKISDYFLDDGEIVSTRGRRSKEDRRYFAERYYKGDTINGKPLIVLINYGSASASEIVAGALQDQKRAILLGETSYGKGSVQSIIPLKNQGAIRLTVSKYYLPSGKSISEVGVVPDIKVEEEGEEFSINTSTDNQLNYAVELFKG